LARVFYDTPQRVYQLLKNHPSLSQVYQTWIKLPNGELDIDAIKNVSEFLVLNHDKIVQYNLQDIYNSKTLNTFEGDQSLPIKEINNIESLPAINDGRIYYIKDPYPGKYYKWYYDHWEEDTNSMGVSKQTYLDIIYRENGFKVWEPESGIFVATEEGWVEVKESDAITQTVIRKSELPSHPIYGDVYKVLGEDLVDILAALYGIMENTDEIGNKLYFPPWNYEKNGFHLRELLFGTIYLYRYGVTDNFYEKNIWQFLPEYDRDQLLAEPRTKLFIDAMGRKMDQIEDYLNRLGNIYDIDECPDALLNHLGQMLGYEKEDFTLQDVSFRELLRNIIEIYKVKGTNYSFSFFFKFLGFNIDLKEFYFNRDVQNPSSFPSIDLRDIEYYLTTTNPIFETKNGLPADHLEKIKNLNDWKIEVESLERMDCSNPIPYMLGFETFNEDGITWHKNPWKYFKTNFIEYSLNPFLTKFSLTASDNETIKKYVRFLSPTYLFTWININISEWIDSISFIERSEDEIKNRIEKVFGDKIDGPHVNIIELNSFIELPTREKVEYFEDLPLNGLINCIYYVEKPFPGKFYKLKNVKAYNDELDKNYYPEVLKLENEKNPIVKEQLKNNLVIKIREINSLYYQEVEAPKAIYHIKQTNKYYKYYIYSDTPYYMENGFSGFISTDERYGKHYKYVQEVNEYREVTKAYIDRLETKKKQEYSDTFVAGEDLESFVELFDGTDIVTKSITNNMDLGPGAYELAKKRFPEIDKIGTRLRRNGMYIRQPGHPNFITGITHGSSLHIGFDHMTIALKDKNTNGWNDNFEFNTLTELLNYDNNNETIYANTIAIVHNLNYNKFYVYSGISGLWNAEYSTVTEYDVDVNTIQDLDTIVPTNNLRVLVHEDTDVLTYKDQYYIYKQNGSNWIQILYLIEVDHKVASYAVLSKLTDIDKNGVYQTTDTGFNYKWTESEFHWEHVINPDELYLNWKDYSYNPYPAVPSEVTPLTGTVLSSNTFTLNWNKIEDQYGYWVQIAKDKGFKNIIYEEFKPNSLNVIQNIFLENDTYYWHVRSKNNLDITHYELDQKMWILNELFKKRLITYSLKSLTRTEIRESIGIDTTLQNLYNGDLVLKLKDYIRKQIMGLTDDEKNELSNEEIANTELLIGQINVIYKMLFKVNSNKTDEETRSLVLNKIYTIINETSADFKTNYIPTDTLLLDDIVDSKKYNELMSVLSILGYSFDWGQWSNAYMFQINAIYFPYNGQVLNKYNEDYTYQFVKPVVDVDYGIFTGLEFNLRWPKLGNVDAYTVEISKNADFNGVEFDLNSSINQITVIVPILQDNDRNVIPWYWRHKCRYLRDGTWSNWSKPLHFTIDIDPDYIQDN
jgi:hypothetical protein